MVDSIYLIGGYIIICLYLYFSACQIRSGYPVDKTDSVINPVIEKNNDFLLFLYMQMPFLYELRNILDWTFSKTSLSLG